MITRQATANISTDYGTWRVSAYSDEPDDYVPHLVLEQVSAPLNSALPTLVRIHSECITGDLFGSTRCDCGEQLHETMRLMAARGGVIIYLRQEGRGIGIIEKLKAYNLQDDGADTVDANTLLGHQADSRNYEMALEILSDMKIANIELLTNNPEKIQVFDDHPITVHRRIPLVVSPRKENEKYLKTKAALMGHIFNE